MGNYFIDREPHPAFPTPQNENLCIWRYTDVMKFLSLLDKKALFFCRADISQAMDPFEGKITKRNHEMSIKELVPYIGEERATQIANTRNSLYLARNLAINCWHINEHESAAMWQLYTNNGQGIAIKATYKSLVESMPPWRKLPQKEDRPVMIGEVRYIDYSTDVFPVMNNALLPFMYKRKSFEHERELRAITMALPINNIGQDPMLTSFPNGGDYLPVDIDVLIKAVYISPRSPAWYKDIIQAAIKNFGYSFPVYQSNLDHGPLW